MAIDTAAQRNHAKSFGFRDNRQEAGGKNRPDQRPGLAAASGLKYESHY
jgi:hypothetical protein